MLSTKNLRELRRAQPAEGNRLRLAMKLANTTQVQVSAAIGIAQSQVSVDAAGKSAEISLDKARAYAEFFGCDVDDLFPAEQAAKAS